MDLGSSSACEDSEKNKIENDDKEISTIEDLLRDIGSQDRLETEDILLYEFLLKYIIFRYDESTFKEIKLKLSEIEKPNTETLGKLYQKFDETNYNAQETKIDAKFESREILKLIEYISKYYLSKKTDQENYLRFQIIILFLILLNYELNLTNVQELLQSCESIISNNNLESSIYVDFIYNLRKTYKSLNLKDSFYIEFTNKLLMLSENQNKNSNEEHKNSLNEEVKIDDSVPTQVTSESIENKEKVMSTSNCSNDYSDWENIEKGDAENEIAKPNQPNESNDDIVKDNVNENKIEEKSNDVINNTEEDKNDNITEFEIVTIEDFNASNSIKENELMQQNDKIVSTVNQNSNKINDNKNNNFCDESKEQCDGDFNENKGNTEEKDKEQNIDSNNSEVSNKNSNLMEEVKKTINDADVTIYEELRQESNNKANNDEANSHSIKSEINEETKDCTNDIKIIKNEVSKEENKEASPIILNENLTKQQIISYLRPLKDHIHISHNKAQSHLSISILPTIPSHSFLYSYISLLLSTHTPTYLSIAFVSRISSRSVPIPSYSSASFSPKEISITNDPSASIVLLKAVLPIVKSTTELILDSFSNDTLEEILKMDEMEHLKFIRIENTTVECKSMYHIKC